MDNNTALATNLSSALRERSQQTAVSLSERYAEVTTIAQAFQLKEAPLAKAEGNVKGSIKLHLAALARFLNLRTTLTDEHIEFIADRMLADDNYKWLKPADLKIFFERIKMGKYGDFYGNLNSISFFQSLDKYMIERNGEIENIRVLEQKEMSLKQPTKLPYFINANGEIEYTQEKKAEMERERQRKEVMDKEAKRKKEAAVAFWND